MRINRRRRLFLIALVATCMVVTGLLVTRPPATAALTQAQITSVANEAQVTFLRAPDRFTAWLASDVAYSMSIKAEFLDASPDEVIQSSLFAQATHPDPVAVRDCFAPPVPEFIAKLEEWKPFPIRQDDQVYDLQLPAKFAIAARWSAIVRHANGGTTVYLVKSGHERELGANVVELFRDGTIYQAGGMTPSDPIYMRSKP